MGLGWDGGVQGGRKWGDMWVSPCTWTQDTETNGRPHLCCVHVCLTLPEGFTAPQPSCQCMHPPNAAGVHHASQDHVSTPSSDDSVLLLAVLPHLNSCPHFPGGRDLVGVLPISPWWAAFLGTVAPSERALGDRLRVIPSGI